MITLPDFEATDAQRRHEANALAARATSAWLAGRGLAAETQDLQLASTA